MAGSRNRRGGGSDIWPGFVDALASLLMVVIFLLMVFVLAQVFLSEALSGRDEQLQRLDRELADLGAMLAIERDANRELRDTVGRLSADLRASTAARDSLREQLLTMTRQAEAASDTVERLRADLAKAEEEVSADKEKIELQLAELAALQEQIAALRKVRDELEGKLAAADRTIAAGETRTETQRAELEKLQQTVAGLEAARKALEDRLLAATESAAAARASAATSEKALAESRAALAESRQALEENSRTLAESRRALDEELAEVARLERLREAVEAARARLEQELADEREKLAAQGRKLAAEQDASRASREEVERLTAMVVELRRDLARLNRALETSEADSASKEAQIVDLGRRLNRALASKVEELARYRSEFFGKLREAIGDRQEIRIVGDRFVFQSEVLFASGVANLGEEGQEQIRKLAATLKDIAGQIPPNIPWILRVDGHTDPVPIRNERFASNWELSTARALAVVRRLIELGVPPSRLAATGFGEYQPLDTTPDSEIAYRRNRRIEFKLTEP